MKPRHVFMGLMTIGAAWLALFADKTPSDQIAEPVTRQTGANQAAAASPTVQKRDSLALTVLALRDREGVIGDSGAEHTPESLFGSQSWTPPPPPPPKPAPPPPPTAPPLPYTYLGKKLEDGVWEVYLGRGEQTLIVRPETTLEGVYKVNAIKPPTLTLTHLPLGQVQTLSIGGAD